MIALLGRSKMTGNKGDGKIWQSTAHTPRTDASTCTSIGAFSESKLAREVWKVERLLSRKWCSQKMGKDEQFVWPSTLRQFFKFSFFANITTDLL